MGRSLFAINFHIDLRRIDLQVAVNVLEHRHFAHLSFQDLGIVDQFGVARGLHGHLVTAASETAAHVQRWWIL